MLNKAHTPMLNKQTISSYHTPSAADIIFYSFFCFIPQIFVTYFHKFFMNSQIFTHLLHPINDPHLLATKHDESF